MKTRLVALLAVLVLTLQACGPQEPIRLGFLGGLSGRVADLGEAGRDGALLAVEDANAAGGVYGRKIELLIQDDEQNPAVAIKSTEALIAFGVVAIIGPMTSSMGEVVLPVATRAELVVVSPTITSTALSGKDDLLFTVAPSVNENTHRFAPLVYAGGARRLAVAYDLSNQAYTEDWAKHFGQDFSAAGGSVVAEASFTSGDDASYGKAVKELAATTPDVLLFIASAVDTVRLIQLSRNLGLQQPVIASTWAATEHFIQLGGRTVEGVVLAQYFNRDDASPRYRGFADAFRARFNQEPGFASVAAYDATTALIAALARADSGRSLKGALLIASPYQGLQDRWSFDRNGDAQRETHITVVRDGRFVLVE